MSRIIELNDSPLRAVINDQGKITQIIDEHGNDMGIPTVAVDPVTGRSEFSNPGQEISPIRRKPYLTKCLASYLNTLANFASNYTQHMQLTLEADFDAVQIGFMNSAAGASVIKSAISSMATAGNSEDTTSNNAGGAWVNVTASGSTTLTIPAANPDGIVNPGVLWSDVMPLRSLARTDVPDGFPILCVRIEYATGGNNLTTVNPMPGNLSGGIANWNYNVERFDAAPWGRFCRIKGQAVVLGVTNIAAFTQTTTAANHAPAVLIRYFLRNGLGRTVVVFGDSIDAGSAQIQNPTYNFYSEAQHLVSKKSDPLEICNFAVGGTAPPRWLARANTFAQYFAGDTAVVANGSVNGLSAPITEPSWLLNKVAALQTMQKCVDSGMRLITRTMVPANYSARAYGASDVTYRHAEQVSRVASSTWKAPVFDAGSIGEGVIDANGQYTFSYADTDNLHPAFSFAAPAGMALAKII